MQKILFESEECELSIDENKCVMHLIWQNKPFETERFIELLEIFVEHIIHQKPFKLFVDARMKKYVIPVEVQVWHEKYIIPNYIEAGVKAMAFITPDKVLSDITLRNTFKQQTAIQKLPARFFTDATLAHQWLDEQCELV